MKSILRAMPLALALGLALVSPAAAGAATKDVRAAQEADDEAPVLPSRVAAPIRRAERALGNAEEHMDEGEYKQSVVSLLAVRRNMYRADRAARLMLAAPPPPEDPDAEETAPPGPDAVVAVLNLNHDITVTTAGLFDTNSKGVVDALTHAMFRNLNSRDRLLGIVIGLDPEGAGADYADVMADTLDGYADEVANLGEARTADTLSTGGRRVLNAAYTQVQNTAATVNAAYGGGE